MSYWESTPARNAVASSVASTWKSWSTPSCSIAAIPSSIEEWRNPAVLEKTSARKRAPGSAPGRTETVTVFDADAVPSDTVTLALYVPASS